MTDQNSQFFATLTAVGEAKQANADALGIPWKITQMGVGDANGTEPTPDRLQKTLINERRRAPLNQLSVDPVNSSIIIAEQVIPADIGGWWIREIGLYDEDGDLVAIANCAPSFKPQLSQGSGRTQVVRMNFIVSSAANVELKIDPSVVLATRAYCDGKVAEELAKLDHKNSVRVATTSNIVLSGTQTVDGVALVAGDRVLVKNQASAAANGIYVVSSGAWSRAADADASIEVTPGLMVPVEQGTANADSVWQLVTDGAIVLGTTALVFEIAAGPSGVTAGTYNSVTVDKRGRVTGGSNPVQPVSLGGTGAITAAQALANLGGVNAAFVQAAIAALVDSSPAALDTLNELAAALGDDPNFAATMTNALAGKQPYSALLAGYAANNGWGIGAQVVDTKTDLNTYQTGGKFITPAAGLTNLPPGWPQGRHILDVSGGESYSMHILASPSYRRVAVRTSSGVGGYAPYMELLHSLNHVEATEDEAAALTAATGWMSPRRVLHALRSAAAAATEALRGVLRIGTQVEVDAGTLDDVVVTPKKMRWGFSASLEANGYIVFPSWLLGFTLQWGHGSTVSTQTSHSWPIAFPTKLLGAVGIDTTSGTPVYQIAWDHIGSTATAGRFGTSHTSLHSFFYLAWGH